MTKRVLSPLGYELAFNKVDAENDNRPGLIFLHGLKSNKERSKAFHLESFAIRRGLANIRMDCMAHGMSGGDWMQATISKWKDDVLHILDTVADPTRKHIIIGSSMGGWLALLAALERPEKVAGVIGIAAAPDFTREITSDNMSEKQKEQLKTKGYFEQPSGFPEPYIFTQDLINDGETNCLLDKDIELTCPVHLLQGKQDPAVPFEKANRIASKLTKTSPRVTFVEDGDHSLSRPEDLKLIEDIIEQMIAECRPCLIEQQSASMSSN